MSAGVAEREPGTLSDEAVQFKPPVVNVGDDVEFYPHATVLPNRQPLYGKVIESQPGSRSCVIATYDKQTPSGLVRQDVLHISDPMLQDFPERAKSGAWDFTKQGKLLRRLDATMERYGDRLVSAEAWIHGMDKNFKPSGSS